MLKLSDKIPKKYSNQKGDPSEETIDIDLQGVGLHKVYDWLPYTFFRVQRMPGRDRMLCGEYLAGLQSKPKTGVL